MLKLATPCGQGKILLNIPALVLDSKHLSEQILFEGEKSLEWISRKTKMKTSTHFQKVHVLRFKANPKGSSLG